jgi:hypothetical protein
LRLVETYVKKAEDLDGVNVNLIPGLLDAILGDYTRNVPAARDAEVLNVMAVIVSKLGVSHPLFDVENGHEADGSAPPIEPDCSYPRCCL